MSEMEEAEVTDDLAAFRWNCADAFAEGVIFYGALTGEGVRLSARRLSGVPVRFALENPVAFDTIDEALRALLEPGAVYQPLPKPLSVGEYPIHAGDKPFAFFRKISRGECEFEVSWRVDFSSSRWTVSKPIV